MFEPLHRTDEMGCGPSASPSQISSISLLAVRMCRPAWCLEASLPSTNANSLPETCRTCWPEATSQKCTLTGHSNWVRRVQFSDDGLQVISGSDDGTVLLSHIFHANPAF